MILGIVGGIGAGKSTVARLFGELGCPTIDADRIAHEILDQATVRDRLRDAFGGDILREDGRVDRRRLASRVFGDPAALQVLNSVIHPGVRERIRDRIERHRARWSARAATGAEAVLVLDVSLLASSPLRDECDVIVFVDVDRNLRAARCEARGWTAQELELREQHQASLEEKRALAQWTIDNSGPPAETRRQAREILAAILDRRVDVEESEPGQPESRHDRSPRCQ